ncbi:NACHT domain-containing protein [Dactylosporangium sp. CA-139114]|uniref:NACHT domain-containing protein n=1 Tax=Dactylosporangium sp. CA-139114 TaxID=3239931 RepID=UPI003D994CD6
MNVATNILPTSWERWEWVSLPLILVLVLVTGVREARGGQGTADPIDSRQALARAVGARLDSGGALSALNPPGPMVVTWTAGRAELSAHRDILLQENGRRLPRIGAFDDVLHLFRQVPTQQLVILGGPGSGKTALSVYLQREILRSRAESEAVPLLVTLSDWDPTHEALTDWFARKALRDHPALGNYHRYGRRAVQRLVEDRIIMPILDGLDEMPADRRAAALRALLRFAGSDHPFVLTCRTEQYADALHEIGSVLPRAAVIEMAPVEVGDAITYLNHRSLPRSRRWEPVEADIRSNPDGPVALALSTPLMIWLAAEVYRGNTDPAVLVDRRRFATADGIQQHLLDGFLPSAYPDGPTSNEQPGPRYATADVRKWLCFLALHLDRKGSRDIVWWQLSAELPTSIRIAVGLFLCVVVGGGLSGFVLGRHNPPLFVAMLTVAMTVPITWALTHAGSQVQPVQLGARATNSAKVILKRSVIGVVVGLIGGIVTGPALGPKAASLVTGLGVLLSILSATFGPPDLARTTAPRNLLRGDAIGFAALAALGLTTGALGWLITELSGSAISARLGAVCIGILTGIFFGIYLLRSPQEIRDSTVLTSRASAVGAIIGAIAFGALGYLIGGLSDQPMINDSWTALGGSAAFGLFFGLLGGLAGTASSWYWIYVRWCWLRGRLPRHLMAFLEDAHRRGVLRQTGAIYQFRHATLQNRLVTIASEISGG